MLLLTLIYEGEKRFISDINLIKDRFRDRNITIGISESMENRTHFVKIFCGDDEVSNKMINIFNLYIADILYKVMATEFYDKNMTCFLNDSYFFLKADELQEIELLCVKVLNGDELLLDDSGIFCMNRRNAIIEKIVHCIEENRTINVDGFITFRTKELFKDMEVIIDKIVERYMVEKEYNEFIKLLKYFVEIQESRIDEVNIIIDAAGQYKVTNKDGKDILDEFLDGIEYKKVDNNIEDLIISGLITNSPAKIVIHGVRNCVNKEIVDTIKNVFNDRVEICNGCKRCCEVKEKIKI
ncbi:putative sporulation protein YtxC [Clostridium oryzae]|uniref:YtxC-like family protein n=1 Tax=Clostridium oryzae TaxID=1450648 RepID=A0A1V4IGT6_9CLOT|nr:putative sporulation protein YtxC [Clostridium oryzae]OPJ59054.1 YtxC-like family protein [Clostridium oryzae]